MNLKEDICNAFCGGLTIRQVPKGFAIGTPYDNAIGDPVGFFVVGPDTQGKFRLQDDGLSVPSIEAAGADLSNKTRAEAFSSLLNEYGINFDEETGELLTAAAVLESEVPAAALRFAAFLLRIQDLILMSQERAASTFREDAIKMIRDLVKDRAQLMGRLCTE